ncbi:translocation/assembly module TamB domain-containing protein [Desulfopila sp. IMCC35008]|uniref:translocation/assembly module TamB domain-containing protein n=1 Tax=Desulfopila sp. IMCC35008 TaxID=2653858 RepID=UPI0013D74396|nr:translocation/assembly module TamB domain-containing protein [Desulfopila sp. IMCC35008]
MKKVLVIIVLLAVLFFGAAGFLLTTERGTRFMVGFVDGISGGAVSVQRVEGSVLSGWVLGNVSINIPSLKVDIFELQMKWQPGRLKERELVTDRLGIQGLSIRLQKSGESTYPKKIPSLPKPEKLLLPVTLVIDTIEINNMTVWDTDGSQLAAVEHVQFGGGYHDGRLEVQELSLSSAGNSLDMKGVLDTDRSWQLDFSGSWASVIPDTIPTAGSFTVTGTVENPVIKADLVQPSSVHFEARLKNLLEKPQWSAQAQANELQLGSFFSPQQDIVIHSDVDFRGDLQTWSGKVSGELSGPDIERADISLDVEGTRESMKLVRGMVDTPYGKIERLEGSLEWQDELRWQASIDLAELTPGIFGKKYDAQLSAKLHSSGVYRRDNPLVAEMRIESFKGIIHGHPLHGEGTLKVAGHQVELTHLDIYNGPAHIALTGALGYSLTESAMPLLDWTVGLQLAEFDPSLFLDEYPGVIDLRVMSRGTIAQGAIQADIDLQELSGEVRGFPLSGSGIGTIRNDSLELEELHFTSGRSEIRMSGRVDDTLGMSVRVLSPDIGEVIAGAGGEVSLQGTIQGSRALPLVDMELRGSGLYIEGGRIESIIGTMKGSPDFGSDLVFSLYARDITSGDTVINDMGIRLSGSAQNHALQVTVKSGLLTMVTEGDGTFDEELVWNGILKKSDLKIRNGGHWNLIRKARLTVSSSGLSMEDFCYSGTGQQEDICLQGGWQSESQQWQGKLRWNGLNLSRFDTEPFLSEQLYGRTEGAISAEGNLEEVSLAQAHIGLFDSSIGRKGDNGDWELADVESLMLDATLYNGKLQGGLTVHMADSNSADATVSIVDFGRFGQDIRFTEISGAINLSANNLDFVAPLTEYYVYPSGALTGKIDLFGTLLDPQAAGTLVLHDGVIDFPTFGVQLEDVVFNVVGESNVLTISAQGTSGPGRLYADGSLTFGLNDLLGEFNFGGENIDTFRLPEYEIRANPDLRLVFDTDGGALFGTLFIPYALLTPEKMTNSLSESDDVVFLDDEDDRTDTGWFFKTLLDVELGDDVRLDGYGIAGYLHGELQVEKLSGSFVTGTGVLTMQDGQFSVYGRTLDIERGRVFFGGGHIDDPGVDVRAQKVVADQQAGPNGITVGVDVSGTAENLDFKLFSDPYMDESDILAYMVVGRSMSDTSSGDENILSSAAMALGINQGTGLIQGLTSILPVDDVYFEGATSGERLSLVVGKRLTDEIFIGYDHNFFDQLGEVTIRYELGRGFYVESRTSADATGADLLFSFER